MGPEWHVLFNLFPPTSVVLNQYFCSQLPMSDRKFTKCGVLSKAKSKQQNSVVIRPEPLRGLATRNITGYVDHMLNPYAALASARKLCFGRLSVLGPQAYTVLVEPAASIFPLQLAEEAGSSETSATYTTTWRHLLEGGNRKSRHRQAHRFGSGVQNWCVCQ